MSGDEEAENFFFSGQARVLIPVRSIGQLVVVDRNFFLLEHAEQAVLAGFRVALRLLRAFHGLVEDGHQLAAATECIHGAALDQRFQDALVQQPQIHLLAEFVDGAIASQFFAPRHDRFDGVVADILYRGQTEADRAAVRREVGVAHIDVGRFDRDAHFAAFVDVLHHVVGAAR